MKKEKETENEKRKKARKSSEEIKQKKGKNLKIVVKTDPSYLGWSIYGLLAAHFGDFF